MSDCFLLLGLGLQLQVSPSEAPGDRCFCPPNLVVTTAGSVFIRRAFPLCQTCNRNSWEKFVTEDYSIFFSNPIVFWILIPVFPRTQTSDLQHSELRLQPTFQPAGRYLQVQMHSAVRTSFIKLLFSHHTRQPWPTRKGCRQQLIDIGLIDLSFFFFDSLIICIGLWNTIRLRTDPRPTWNDYGDRGQV